ncbi:MAG TPA: thermonuclease family protein [Abditibacteriaceae bacterium]
MKKPFEWNLMNKFSICGRAGASGLGRALPTVALAACMTPVLFLGGCDVLKGPEPEPVPTPMKLPTTEVFSAEDNITRGTKLPGVYRVAGITSAEVLTIQSVVATKKGTPPRDVLTYGVAEQVHLAGIITPQSGQPGWQSAVKTVTDWTNGKIDLEVEQDPKYPTDLSGRRMVQIYFKGRTPATSGTTYNLNRMLVRSGYAVVDVHQATSIDVQKWMYDEESARSRKDANGKVTPIGLWKLGIILGQRIPAPRPTVAAAPGKPGALTTKTTTVKTSAPVAATSTP